MEFSKYRKRGAYHWHEHAQQTAYGQHADWVAAWVWTVADGAILDVGAGDGLISHLFSEAGWTTVRSIDNDPHGIAAAKKKGVDVQMLDVYDMLWTRCVDAVYCGDVIEHLEFPRLAVARMRNALRPGGMLYVVTPPARDDGVILDPHHYREYTPSELVNEVMSVGGLELVGKVIVKPEWRRMYAAFRRVDV